MLNKKILAAGLAATMLIGQSSMAFAKEIGSSPTSASTNVSLTVSDTYSVEIPEKIEISATTKQANYMVGVKGDIAANKTVKVTPDASVTMTDTISGTRTTEATITAGKTAWESADINANTFTEDSTSLVEAPASILAGSYSGTLNFAIVC